MPFPWSPKRWRMPKLRPNENESINAKEAAKNPETSKNLSEKVGSLLKTNKTMEDCRDIIDKAKNAITTNNITISSWSDTNNAKGLATDASIVFLSNLADALVEIGNNLESTSGAAVALNDLNSNIKTLLIKFSEKKEKEDDLVLKEKEFSDTLKEIPDGTDSSGNTIYKPNPRYSELEEAIKELKKAIDKLNEEISLLQNIIDAKYKLIVEKYSELSNLSSKLQDHHVSVSSNVFGTSGDVPEDYKSMLSTLGIGTKLVTYNGTEYLVCDTSVDIEELQSYIQSNNLYQDAGFMGGKCNILSMVYAKDLVEGSYTGGNDYDASVEDMFESVTSDGTSLITETMYEELKNGRPVVLQVSQKDPTKRHFVTVVGYDSSVTSAKDLTTDKLLVVDCWNGQIRQNKRTLTSNSPKGLYQVKILKKENYS